MASQLTLIKSRRLLPKVAEEMDEQRISSRTSFSNWKSTVLQAIRRVDGLTARGARPYYSKPKMELVTTIQELLHDRTTVDLFLVFKTIDQEKEEFRQNHTTIVKDEYKIEDLMDQLRHRFPIAHKFSCRTLFWKQRSPRGHYSISCNPELIKIQEVTWSRIGLLENCLNRLNMSKLAEIEALLFVAGEEGLLPDKSQTFSLTSDRCGAKFRKIKPKIPGGHRYQSVFDGTASVINWWQRQTTLRFYRLF